MSAIECWVPTIRDDFPSTIPFWVKIKGLPIHCCYEDGVKEIGKKLGELVASEVTPQPRVQVVLECELPLVFERDLEFENGDIITVNFIYDKLDRYCKRCLRILMT